MAVFRKRINYRRSCGLLLFPFTSLNKPIGNWDVSNVTNMDGMFYRATSFNQDISTWDVSSVTDMSDMFNNAHLFNQDLSSWNVDNATICNNFYEETPSWTLPHPCLSNCGILFIGMCYQGGIIAYIDSTGQHRLNCCRRRPKSRNTMV